MAVRYALIFAKKYRTLVWYAFFVMVRVRYGLRCELRSTQILNVPYRSAILASLCLKCSLEDETPNHHVSNCKLYQDICGKYFGIIKITVYDVVTKCNINKLAMYLNV